MQHAAARRIMDALERRQEALWKRIEREVDADMRAWKASPKTWSLTEIVQHVGLAEHALLGTARPARRLGNPLGGVRFWTLWVAMKSPLRFRAPVTQILPTPDVTWGQATEAARSAVQRWQAYLTSQSEPVVFMHPIVGALTAQQTVAFLGNHFDHHVPQIERLMRSSPAGSRLIWS